MTGETTVDVVATQYNRFLFSARETLYIAHYEQPQCLNSTSKQLTAFANRVVKIYDSTKSIVGLMFPGVRSWRYWLRRNFGWFFITIFGLTVVEIEFK